METHTQTGTLIELTVNIGPWAAGTIGKVIPNPYRTISYADVNSTGKREVFNEGPASVWIIVSNKNGLDTHTKFPVTPDEIKAVVR